MSAGRSDDPAVVITRAFERSGGPRHLEHAVFGTAEPQEVAAQVDRFCRRHLGAAVAGYRFYATSVGSVHGVMLEDQRAVVIKARPASGEAPHLHAMQHVQRHLVEAGYPCPTPLLGPTPIGSGTAVVESLLPGGRAGDGRAPATRRALAEGLARLVVLCRGFAVPPLLRPVFLVAAARGSLWPVPHDPRFDFEGTEAGAEWIDRIAAGAQHELRGAAGDEVVGHGDWRVEHVRFDEQGRLSSVFDWDSLGRAREPVVVGLAAHGFTADWSRDPPPPVPSAAHAHAFIADYEAARGEPFAAPERRTAAAALLYATAYGARCQHSDEMTDFGAREPGEPPPDPEHGTYRHLLAELASGPEYGDG